MRVYELAKELGITSKEALQKLHSLGIQNIKSNMNSLTKDYENSLRNAVKGIGQKKETKAAADHESGENESVPQKKEQKTLREDEEDPLANVSCRAADLFMYRQADQRR